MAYTPKLSDIKDAPYSSSAASSSNTGYVPKLSDIKDKPSAQKPTGGNNYIKQRENAYKEALMGAGEGIVNQGIKLSNLFTDKPTQEVKFTPDTDASRLGKVAGEVGSYFIPGGALTGALKGASYIPKIGELVKAAQKGVASYPLLKSSLKVGKAGGEAALFNAANNPQDAKMAALEGGGIGAGMQGAANLLTTQSPLIKSLAGAGLGAGIGSMFGHPAVGAAAGLSAPTVLKQFGAGKSSVPEDVLQGLSQKDVMKSKFANDQLGTTVTPAQASGNYVTSANEGYWKRSPEAAQKALRYENKQTSQQSNAINDMLNKIYVPSLQNEAKINSLYEQAGKWKLHPNVISQMKENPIISSSFNSVKGIPAFSNIPENSYQFLAEVSRNLYRNEKSSLPNKAYLIRQVRNPFNEALKQNNPYYDAATKAAQPKIVRQNIEDKFNRSEGDYTGKNFYNKFLNLKKPYKDLLQDTNNFPEAQESIKNMRAGWKHLSNVKTVSQGEAQAKSAISDTRDPIKAIKENMKHLAGSKQDIDRIDAIYSKDWDKGFHKIAQIKDQKQRNREYLSLFGKIATAYGLSQE